MLAETKEKARLSTLSRKIRLDILEMAERAKGGHIAPSFSCIEILLALYHGRVLRVDAKNPKWEDRDRFILSKGHAGLSLYAVLANFGFFPVNWLNLFNMPRGKVGGMTHSTVPGVELSTGALGHGLSVGAGMALAARMDKKMWRVFVLLGDGECQEGVTWETAMFAAHHHLGNLVAVIDRNRLQALDDTEDTVKLEPLVEKWQRFGWSVSEVDGHNIDELKRSLTVCSESSRPHLLVAHTVKGKGLSFMENRPIWHYRVPKNEEMILAKEELQL